MKGKKPLDNYHRQNVVWLALVETMCGVLERDNPRFDRKRFLNACGALQ